MYTLTLFPSAKLINGSKDDKRRVAPFATIGEPVTLDSFEAVVELASLNTISFNEYSASDKCRDGQVHRHGQYFVRTNLIGLDVDDNLTLDDTVAALRAKGWKFGLYTSFNHQKEGGDKFRVVLELEDYVSDPSIYLATWESLHTQFLGIDTSTKDIARLYFHSDPETRLVIVEEGALVPIVTTGPAFARKAHSTQLSTSQVDASGFESASVRAKLPIEVRNWIFGVDEYGETIDFRALGRNSQFFKVANLSKERGYDRDWCDTKLGARLRIDDDFMASYGEGKIQATLDQIFSRESRHGMPALFTFPDLDDPRKFVSAWVSTNTYKVNRNGLFVKGNVKATPRTIYDTLSLDYDSAYRDHNKLQDKLSKEDQRKVRRLNKDSLQSAVNEYVAQQQDLILKQLREDLAFLGDDGNLSELRAFTHALMGRDDETCLAVLAHFIWQVKRKIFGFEVQYHLMPILTGKQGTGKSYAISKYFLSPMAGFTLTPKLSELVDGKNASGFARNFVVFCDEMEQADRTDVDGLKNFLTTPSKTVRALYTETQMEHDQNCTAIGCSNRTLGTMIYDPTGMRRFYEITVDDNMRENGWKAMPNIDFKKMWKQIDENIPGERCFYIPLQSQIQVHQEELRVESPIESFINECGARVSSGAETTEVLSDEFYSDYRMFCGQNGHKAKDKNFFGKHLAEFGITKRQKKVGEGRRPYFYAVGSSYCRLIELS